MPCLAGKRILEQEPGKTKKLIIVPRFIGQCLNFIILEDLLEL